MTIRNLDTAHPVRLAIVGCGAVVEHLHLPALAGREDCDVTTLVDPRDDRTTQLAHAYGIPSVLADHRDLEDVDAAIVAVPNHLHAPVAIDLLRAGIAVLIEKPVARTEAEARTVQEVSLETGVMAAAGMALRFAAVNRAVHGLLVEGAFGEVRSFTARAGVEFGWPVASSYIVDPRQAGGGVLIDVGVHVLDLLLWWLGDVDALTYRDDSYGGMEADCLLELTMRSGATGTVELSRTRDLGHVISLRSERGEVRVGFVGDEIELSIPGGGITGEPTDEVEGGRGHIVSVFAAEHEDFLTAVRTGRPPSVPLEEALRSLSLVDTCYRERDRWELPWIQPAGVGQ